ncbi:hypothetical protein ElyMa_000092200 [Elysia marginata]|uniref:Uncharacterized protein n=1 Tax=Elysia marginata TaxID=1093978 RepID=A0AAV4EIW3_9GAST|nr:hypothetical protein ElyMa_000092200 [Elysia marginata]
MSFKQATFLCLNKADEACKISSDLGVRHLLSDKNLTIALRRSFEATEEYKFVKPLPVCLSVGHRSLSQMNFRTGPATCKPACTNVTKLSVIGERGATADPSGDYDLDTEHESLLNLLITTNGAWIHQYTPEFKKVSIIWKRPSSSPARKFKTALRN